MKPDGSVVPVIRLRNAWRPRKPEHRPTATGEPHPRSAAGRALQLVQSIQEHAAGITQRPVYQPMTLVNRGSAPASNETHVQVNINLPEIQFGNPARSGTATPPSAPVRRIERPLMEMARSNHSEAPGGKPTQSVVETIQRLTVQHERVETATRYQMQNVRVLPAGTSPALSTILASPAGGILQPAPQRVVAHAPPQKNALQHNEEQNGGRSAGAISESMPAAAALANSLDVNRLTDQVIQAIDRRIIASRERLGRI